MIVGRDLALQHTPGSEANKVLKKKTAKNVCQQCGVPEDSLDARQLPVSQAVWRMFMNSCMWAAVRLSKKVSGSVPMCSSQHGC